MERQAVGRSHRTLDGAVLFYVLTNTSESFKKRRDVESGMKKGKDSGPRDDR